MANWEETKAKLKQKMFRVRNDNILLIKEHEEAVLRKLEAKLGETRAVILKIISRL